MIEVSDISQLNINDSTLIETVVLIDSVEMELNYITSYEDQRVERMTLVFEGCRKADFTINPGFAGRNSLLGAEEEEAPEGRRIRIETNTTAGIIRIECAEVHLRESRRVARDEGA